MEVYYHGIKLETMNHYLKNFTKYNSKREGIIEEKVLETDAEGNPSKMYSRFKIPMMNERESLVKLEFRRLTGEHEGKTLFICHSYDDPAYPINPKVIRMTTF